MSILFPNKRNSISWEFSKSRQWTPFLALSLITLSVGVMGASAAVVILSDGDSVSSWSIAPPVILAIISSLFNIFLATLLSVSVAIVWWRSATRGTSINSLHMIWERGMGTTFFSAVWSGSDARRVAVAAILIALVKSAHNPLLQNSLDVETRIMQEMVPMKVSMAHEIPTGLLGNRTGAPDYSTELLDRGARSFGSWYFNDSLVSIPAQTASLPEWKTICPVGTNSTCGGWACPSDKTCKARMKAPGISFACRNTTDYIDLSDEANIGVTVFHTQFELDNSTTTPSLNLFSVHTFEMDENNNATRSHQLCSIRPATKEYTVSIGWSEFISVEWEPDIVVNYSSEGDLLYAPKGVGAGPLAVMASTFGPLYNAISIYENPTTITSNIISTMFWRNVITPSGFEKWYYEDPVPRLLEGLENWSIFAGQTTARVSKGIYDQDILATHYTPVTNYRANYRFLTAALVVIAIGLLSVILLSTGWRDIHRPNTTLSPVEIARAFGCPTLMHHENTPANIDDLLRDVGHLRVKYDGNVMVADLYQDEGDVDIRLLGQQRQ